MKVRSIYFDGNFVHIIDQRYLPFEIVDVVCKNEEDVFEALKK